MTMSILGKDICSPEKMAENLLSPVQKVAEQVTATQNYYAGLFKYFNSFFIPYLLSTHYFGNVEKTKLLLSSPLDILKSYADLCEFNIDLTSRSLVGSLKAANEFHAAELQNVLSAWFNTMFGFKGEKLEGYTKRQVKALEAITKVYPKAITDIEPEYGFHFESGKNIKVAETDRFFLYQIMPTDSRIEVKSKGKPILIIPPFVLGANILAFLPGENRSYTHCFANMGIPTYVRIMKNIDETPALQLMTAEDDTLDTRLFCEKIMARHGKPVTLNGYCQGGYTSVCNILSGELDGLVDALITCVSPMDGTRSVGLKKFLDNLPPRFKSLDYGTKTLPNGNQVADGKLLSWVYKLKSIENESPLVAFYRDIMMLRPKNGSDVKISKSAAALNYWLDFERCDLPLAVTKMSYDSYSIPVTSDGTLPIKLFGRKLNFRRIKEKGIKWLICYGINDDLVEKEAALAPLDYINVEVSAFPKGHVAIATSWSDPRSACALHTRFGEQQFRGPVRFQLDIDEEISNSRS